MGEERRVEKRIHEGGACTIGEPRGVLSAIPQESRAMEGNVQMAGGNGLARHSKRKATNSRHEPHGERGGQRELVFGR